jgi:hypothetical protein
MKRIFFLLAVVMVCVNAPAVLVNVNTNGTLIGPAGFSNYIAQVASGVGGGGGISQSDATNAARGVVSGGLTNAMTNAFASVVASQMMRTPAVVFPIAGGVGSISNFSDHIAIQSHAVGSHVHFDQGLKIYDETNVNLVTQIKNDGSLIVGGDALPYGSISFRGGNAPFADEDDDGINIRGGAQTVAHKSGTALGIDTYASHRSLAGGDTTASTNVHAFSWGIWNNGWGYNSFALGNRINMTNSHAFLYRTHDEIEASPLAYGHGNHTFGVQAQNGVFLGTNVTVYGDLTLPNTNSFIYATKLRLDSDNGSDPIEPATIYHGGVNGWDTFLHTDAGLSVGYWFIGSGWDTNSSTGISNLNASALSSGTVPLGRLSGISSNQMDAATDAAYRAGGGGGITAAQASNIVRHVAGVQKWYNVADYGANPNDAVCDQMQIQAAIDAAAGDTNTAIQAVVWFPATTNGGRYLMLGPSTNDGAQLSIRGRLAYMTNLSSITLRGESSPMLLSGTATTGYLPNVGSVITSLETSSGGAMLTTTRGTVAPFYPTYYQINIEDLDFRTAGNSYAVTALRLTNGSLFRIERVSLSAGTNYPGSTTTLPVAGSIGIEGPPKDRGNLAYLDVVNVFGFYQNVRVGEHMTINRLNIGAGIYGLVATDCNLANYVGHVTIQQNNYPIYFDGGGNLNVDVAVIETSNTDWKTNIWHVSGSSPSVGRGTINLWVQDNVGSAHNTIKRSGAQYVEVKNLRDTKYWNINTTGQVEDRGPVFLYEASGGQFGGISLVKQGVSGSAGTTTPAAVSQGQGLGMLRMGGYSGAAGIVTPAGAISYVDGPVSSGNIPAGIGFFTGTNNTANKLQFNVDSMGRVVASNHITSVNGYFSPTNNPLTWPTAPRTHGEAFWGNSNGVIYLLTSVPGSLAWAATNKVAP